MFFTNESFCLCLRYTDSIGATGNFELHQLRRKPLEKFLSRQNVSRLQNVINEELRILDRKVSSAKNTGSQIRLDHMFTSFTGDIVGEVACGENPSLLDAPGSTPEWYDMIRGAARIIPVIRHFPQVGEYVYLVIDIDEIVADLFVIKDLRSLFLHGWYKPSFLAPQDLRFCKWCVHIFQPKMFHSN